MEKILYLLFSQANKVPPRKFSSSKAIEKYIAENDKNDNSHNTKILKFQHPQMLAVFKTNFKNFYKAEKYFLNVKDKILQNDHLKRILNPELVSLMKTSPMRARTVPLNKQQKDNRLLLNKQLIENYETIRQTLSKQQKQLLFSGYAPTSFADYIFSQPPTPYSHYHAYVNSFNSKYHNNKFTKLSKQQQTSFSYYIACNGQVLVDKSYTMNHIPTEVNEEEFKTLETIIYAMLDAHLNGVKKLTLHGNNFIVYKMWKKLNLNLNGEQKQQIKISKVGLNASQKDQKTDEEQSSSEQSSEQSSLEFESESKILENNQQSENKQYIQNLQKQHFSSQQIQELKKIFKQQKIQYQTEQSQFLKKLKEQLQEENSTLKERLNALESCKFYIFDNHISFIKSLRKKFTYLAMKGVSVNNNRANFLSKEKLNALIKQYQDN